MAKYGSEEPPLIDLESIDTVPIAIYAGVKDKIVNIEDNRLVRDQLRTVVNYQELDFDHLSFLLAKNMTYFDDVLKTIKMYNPIDPSISVYEK